MKTLKSILVSGVLFLLFSLTTEANAATTLRCINESTFELNENSPSYYLRNFCEQNAKLISLFAHPTSDYRYSSVEVYGKTAYITITTVDMWGDNYNLKVKVWVNSMGFIGGIKLISDEDFWPPFASITILKSLIDDMLRENEDNEDVQKAKSVTAQILDKTYYQWDGKGLCLFALNAEWVNKNNHLHF